jgi:hypothetical protein
LAWPDGSRRGRDGKNRGAFERRKKETAAASVMRQKEMEAWSSGLLLSPLEADARVPWMQAVQHAPSRGASVERRRLHRARAVHVTDREREPGCCWVSVRDWALGWLVTWAEREGALACCHGSVLGQGTAVDDIECRVPCMDAWLNTWFMYKQWHRSMQFGVECCHTMCMHRN